MSLSVNRTTATATPRATKSNAPCGASPVLRIVDSLPDIYGSSLCFLRMVTRLSFSRGQTSFRTGSRKAR